jgi:hypothetical protein
MLEKGQSLLCIGEEHRCGQAPLLRGGTNTPPLGGQVLYTSDVDKQSLFRTESGHPIPVV